MGERPVVTCFLRNDGEILLLRRSEAVGSYAGRWGGVAGHVAREPEHREGSGRGERQRRERAGESGEQRDPETAARAEIAEETGLADAVALSETGDPFAVEDGGRRWLVRPLLFDCESRAVSPNEETAEWAWVHPPEILRRETVPRLWTSYDRVRPRVATLADRTHGSAWLSVRALETLRDEAALAVEGHDDSRETSERYGDDWAALASLARRLREARPAMAVVENRINRAMAAASDERTAGAVEDAARETLELAVEADDEAARLAAAALPDRVATLSRSGTVLSALRRADPEAVLVAESRPGGEGVGVAESLSGATDVTLTTDAALAAELDVFDAGAVVVGADRLLPDGRVVNKVGTRGAALAAAEVGIDCLVVAAGDKVAADSDYDREPRPAAELYDGPAELSVANPTFDVTRADAVTVITERGRRSTAEVRALAEAHRERADWASESR